MSKLMSSETIGRITDVTDEKVVIDIETTAMDLLAVEVPRNKLAENADPTQFIGRNVRFEVSMTLIDDELDTNQLEALEMGMAAGAKRGNLDNASIE